MPVLNTNSIDAVKLGGTNIDAIYKSGVRIWPSSTPELIARYRNADISGSSGTIADSSGNGHDLDKATGSFLTPITPKLNLQAFTVEGWLDWWSSQTVDGNALVCEGTKGSSVDDRSHIRYHKPTIYQRYQNLVRESGGLLSNVNWWDRPPDHVSNYQHFAVTISALQVKYWANGVLIGTKARTNSTWGFSNFTICEITSGTQPITSRGVRIWSTEKYTSTFTPENYHSW